jgi:hypothetical protein
MKRNILFTTAALFATGSLLAASKEDVSAAIKKLADGGNYSWTSTISNVAPAGGGGGGFGGGGFGGGGRGGRGGGPTSGKITKDGYMLITRGGFQGNTTETITKGEKSVTKNQEGQWQTPEEMAAAFGGGGGGGGFGGGRGFGRGGAGATRLPTLDAQELLAAVSELKSADGALSGDLSKEAVNARLSPFGGRGFGGGGGGEAPPPPADAKGSVKYWLKDGALSKYEFTVQGTMDFGGNEFPINRTTTVEFKDVGSTKVEVPEDAKKKLQ